MILSDPALSMYYTYVIQHKGKGFYIGFTGDLKRRMSEHQKKRECVLLYYEAYRLKQGAQERERKLKQYGSAWRALKKRIIAERAGCSM